MAIASLDQYIAAIKQCCPWMKTGTRVGVAQQFCTAFDVVGAPGAGVLAIGNTANGVVPTDAVAGYPPIDAFTGDKGYFTSLEFNSTVAGRIFLSDRVFAAGAYSYAAGTTTLSSQPSYSTRVPGGTDYKGLQIWIEVVTAFVTGTAWQVQITYTNQAGTAGRTSIISVARAAAALILGEAFQIALQSGDSGVQKIESVIVTNGGTAMTAGTFNVMVLRPLIMVRVPYIGFGDVYDLLRTGMVQVFADSALYVLIANDSTALGVPYLNIEIAN